MPSSCCGGMQPRAGAAGAVECSKVAESGNNCTEEYSSRRLVVDGSGSGTACTELHALWCRLPPPGPGMARRAAGWMCLPATRAWWPPRSTTAPPRVGSLTVLIQPLLHETAACSAWRASRMQLAPAGWMLQAIQAALMCCHRSGRLLRHRASADNVPLAAAAPPAAEKPGSWLFSAAARLFGQSASRGASSLVYAAAAPEVDGAPTVACPPACNALLFMHAGVGLQEGQDSTCLPE